MIYSHRFLLILLAPMLYMMGCSSPSTIQSGSRDKGGIYLGFGTGSYSRSGGSSVGVSTGPIGGGQVEQSTLTVRIVEPNSQELLWVGWIDKLEENKFTADQFREKMKEIMAQLPSR